MNKEIIYHAKCLSYKHDNKKLKEKIEELESDVAWLKVQNNIFLKENVKKRLRSINKTLEKENGDLIQKLKELENENRNLKNRISGLNAKVYTVTKELNKANKKIYEIRKGEKECKE